MWDDGYPMVPAHADHQVRLRAHQPWLIAARADEVDREMQERANAMLSPTKRRGLRWWLHWLRWKQL